MKIYKKIDIAYMAGLFDGEGCVFIAKDKKGYKGAPVEYFHLMIHISNADPDVIEWVSRTFGGSMHVSKPGTGGRRKIWIWVCKSRTAGKILKLMLPYLKVKKEQAIIGMRMQETCNYRGGSKRTPPEVTAFRAECKKQISALNHRLYEQAHSEYNAMTGAL